MTSRRTTRTEPYVLTWELLEGAALRTARAAWPFNTIATRALGAIQGLISFANEAFDTHAMCIPTSNTQAHSCGEGAGRCQDWFASHIRPNAFRDVHCIVRITARQNDKKLLPSVPPDLIAWYQACRESIRHDPQDRIADRVSVRVVHLLESINVGKHDRNRLVLLSGMNNRTIHGIVYTAPI